VGGPELCGWWGKLKPLPEKLFFISAFTERLIVVT
jgi:hypothetical protein